MATYVAIAAGVLLVVWLVRGGSSGTPLRIGAGAGERWKARIEPLRQEGPAWMASGRAVREAGSGGRARFELVCSGIRTGTGEPRIPAGAELEVAVGGAVLGRAPLRHGEVRLALRSERGEAGPETRAEIRYRGVPLLHGQFRRD